MGDRVLNRLEMALNEMYTMHYIIDSQSDRYSWGIGKYDN